MSKTTFQIEGYVFSRFELEDILRQTAIQCGAKGDMLAVLLRHIPQLLLDIQSADLKTSEGFISLPLKLQYEMWTEGQHQIVDTIDKYKQKQDQYLFWGDITNTEYKSLGKAKPSLSAPAVRLLLYLAENIGTSVPRAAIFERLFGTSPEGLDGWRCRLAHYLTELQNFAEENFRKLYFSPPDRLTDTLTLKKSFSDKYFIFLTLASFLSAKHSKQI